MIPLRIIAPAFMILAGAFGLFTAITYESKKKSSPGPQALPAPVPEPVAAPLAEPKPAPEPAHAPQGITV